MFNLDHFPAEYDLIFSFWFDLQKIPFYIIVSFFLQTYMKHNKYVPITRNKLNEIKEYPKYLVIMEAQEDMFSEYDKIGIKSKILYEVYYQIKRAHTSFSIL